jgi:hypothetical protein
MYFHLALVFTQKTGICLYLCNHSFVSLLIWLACHLECIALEAVMLTPPSASSSGVTPGLWGALVMLSARAADVTEEKEGVDGINMLQVLFEQAVVSKLLFSSSNESSTGSLMGDVAANHSTALFSLPTFASCATLFRSLLKELCVVSNLKNECSRRGKRT